MGLKRDLLKLKVLLTTIIMGFAIIFNPATAKAHVKGYVVRVIDGDTFVAMLEALPGLQLKVVVRLARVDTPEIKGKCPKERYLAQIAKSKLKTILRSGRKIKLRKLSRGYYGRIISEVYVDEKTGEINLSDYILKNKLGIAYGSYKPWCEKPIELPKQFKKAEF